MTAVASAPVRHGNTDTEYDQNPSPSLSRSPVCDGKRSPEPDTGSPGPFSLGSFISRDKRLPTRKMSSLEDTDVGKGSEVGAGQRDLFVPQAPLGGRSALNQNNPRKSAPTGQVTDGHHDYQTSNTPIQSDFHGQMLDAGGIVKVDRGAQWSPWGGVCKPDDSQGWNDPEHTHDSQARGQPAAGASNLGQERGDVQSSMEVSGPGDRLSPAAGQRRERPRSSVQVAAKRKRVFSNRTKTGCLTCRRRKKKCDEQHPICNNCNRGGFECEGYVSLGTWQRPPTAKVTVPLQSKKARADDTGRGPSQSHGGQSSPVESSGAKRGPSAAVDHGCPVSVPSSLKPIEAEMEYESLTKLRWTGPGTAGHGPEYMTQSEPGEASVNHDRFRSSSPIAKARSGTPLRESMYVGLDPGLTFPGSEVGQASIHSDLDNGGAQASTQKTEKEKMLGGDLYQPFDSHLVAERDLCQVAVQRFNNCHGIKNQNQCFKEVLAPTAHPAADASSAAIGPLLAGSIGQGAIVTAPFRCHYGYNIHIGEGVLISESCLFADDCRINIGAETWIGPGVTILSAMAHHHMAERRGSRTRYQGSPVNIGNNCYLGANCTILPGVHLQQGAYVAAGEVVGSSMGPYGVRGCPPSYMLYGRGG